jgi:Cysteine-rich domain
VSPVSQDITYHDPCYLGRPNKVYEAPRELIGASGATLTEMPRHADRGLCCGAGGARMWMEEHIGKRVNHERVEEALDTGASKIATGCPFCRVMMTDGVDDRAEAMGKEKAEVLDVAQLLLGSLDKSTVTLPEKGTAAKQAEERAAKVEVPTAPVATEAPEEAPAEAKAATAAETKPVTGLGIAGGAKRPGAKKTAAPAAAPADDKPAAPAATGLGIAAGARRPGAKKTPAAPAVRPAETSAAAPEPASAEEAKPEAPVKGLAIAGGARRPGAKKSTPAPQPTAAEPPSTAVEPQPTAVEPKPTATTDDNGEQPAPPVKGLGIARGARPPGKR